MGAILGTVAGWQYDDDYSSDHRTYRAPGYYKIMMPKKKVIIEERWEYYVGFKVTIYLCDSKNLISPLVIRRIGSKDNPIKIREIRDSEQAGGLDRWVYNVTTREVEELLARSNTETAGLVPCECEQLNGQAYNIEIFEQEETLPVEIIPPVTPVPPVKVPTVALEQIKTLEKRLIELEKIKSEIEKNINVARGAIERLREAGKVEMMRAQEGSEKRLMSELKVQNTIIKRQTKAIDNLKRQYEI